MAFLLTWKKCFAGSLEIGQCSSAGTTQELFTRFMGWFFLEGPKQANRSSETARNFLLSAFRLLRFFLQTEHLKTSFLHSIDTIIAIKKQNTAAVAPFCFPRSRLYGSAATRLRIHNSILFFGSCYHVLIILSEIQKIHSGLIYMPDANNQ